MLSRQVTNERHAADGTVAGRALPNLWMHRAGVDRSHRGWRHSSLCRSTRRLDVFAGVLTERLGAMPTAETIQRPLIRRGFGCVRTDLHAAYRIDQLSWLMRCIARARVWRGC